MSDLARAWITAIAVAAGVWLVGWVVLRLLLAWFGSWARRTSLTFDDHLVRAVRPQLPLWFLLLGVTSGARYAPLERGVVRIVDQAALAIFAVSAALAAAAFFTRLLGGRSPGASTAPRVNTLIQSIVYGLFLGVAGLVVLGNLGISVTPLVTALGIGSLAVALALQPTLTNLFAGMHILVARHVRVGDMIELEGGQQGMVVDIGWRSTLIRELPDNTFIVPNARLVEMIVKSFGLPDSEHNVIVPVGVGYGADLDHAMRVTREVAEEVQGSAGLGTPFQPVVQVRGFGASAIDLNVVVRVPHFVERGQMVHELLRRLHARYRAEGIDIPYPQLVVHLPAGTPEAPAAAPPSTP